MKIELKTERLLLKNLDSSYAKAVLEYYIDNKKFFESKVPEYSDDYFTEKYHFRKLDSSKEDFLAGSHVKFWIFKKIDPRKIIGDISISNIVRGAFLSCHLGYKLDEYENGKGYAREALGKIIDYSFNELSLHRIEANIMPSNYRSIKVAEKLGFVNEGRSKKYLKINGNWEDHFHYVLLNENSE